MACERCGNPHLSHHFISHRVLHEGVVLKRGVQRELVKSKIGLPFFEMIEFNFEAEALGTVFMDLIERIVSFDAESDIEDCVAIDEYVRVDVFFRTRVFEYALPIRLFQDEVDGVNAAHIEQATRIPGRAVIRSKTQRTGVHEHDNEGDHKQGRYETNLVDVSMFEHERISNNV